MNLWGNDTAVDMLNEGAMGSMPAEDPIFEDVAGTSPPVPNSEYSMSTKSRKRKLDAQDANSNMQKLIGCIRESNEFMYKFINPQPTEKEYTKKEIYEELNKLGVPHHRVARAYVTLAKNKEYTEVFFDAPEDVRLEVLNEMMSI